ncbi:hypothetical protein [Sphingosinicella rhizophila]|uniref:Heme exporter protein D n=1 Tax=Sphingosinicella rhizophila TaxID=3050082 RepID=A0ABU3Q3D3_9SPHN|nr:hypothetical protein [Sphingosinicella sp. GR2756]MDT9597782.1 hypothetical protein [Sphingosinicella sp. GR2756]
MNPWPFIIVAYALTFVGTGGLVWQSLVAMRRAEAEAEALRGDK